MTPYITANNDTIKVGDQVQLTEGGGTNGQFLYVQLLNGFNEPVSPATSRAASTKQPVLFFKEQDGVTYLFTKYFVINTEAALNKGEVKRLPAKK